MLLLTFPDYKAQAQRLAKRLRVDFAEIYLHHFPDRESLLRLPTALPEHIVIVRSLDRPNDKLIELLFCAKTAREQGVKRITLVAPYLCYMRQDIANQPGEAVSQRIIGKLLADLFDDVITVDPHLHRISHLQQAIPLKNAVALSAADEIAGFLAARLDHAHLLGPDAESEQWVSGIAQKIAFSYSVASKVRQGDKKVDIHLPDGAFKEQTVVIIDDMASTGRTTARAAALLKVAGAREVYSLVTHALFCGDAEKYIRESGVAAIWSTDSITHTTSEIPLAGMLADAIEAIT